MEETRIAVIGSGFAGLGMAIRLKQGGHEDFLVLERSDEVGGTWRDNTYPGCGCDVVAHIYSYSFAPNPNWSHSLAPQREIRDYLRDCTDRYGIRPHLRLRHDVRSITWQEHERRWLIDTAEGPVSAQFVVQATGPMSDPWIPDLPGRERFEGTAFHSARWRHDHELQGRRVAVIGTGASAIQFVPRIQPEVERLLVFQRTAPWVVPRPMRRITRFERFAYRHVPGLQRVVRAMLFLTHESAVIALRRPWMMRMFIEPIVWARVKMQVRDRKLRDKLRPSIRAGCKRILLSNDWYPALCKDNVDVVDGRIREIRERSIVTADGAEHEVDTIVYATGFHVTDPPLSYSVRGRDGVAMGELFERESPQALRGTTVNGFPNYFIVVGPNTGTGINTLVFNMESQFNYIVRALEAIDALGAEAVEPRAEAQESYNRMVQDLLRGTVWTTGCASHYIDHNGRNVSLWPHFMLTFRAQTRRFDPAEYVLYSPNGSSNGRAHETATSGRERTATA
jgi:cation diffusion facilitator CzcD-associated flavoprotein CzcO